jgi:hypothetical protein
LRRWTRLKRAVGDAIGEVDKTRRCADGCAAHGAAQVAKYTRKGAFFRVVDSARFRRVQRLSEQCGSARFESYLTVKGILALVVPHSTRSVPPRVI